MKASWALVLMAGGMCVSASGEIILEEHSGYSPEYYSVV